MDNVALVSPNEFDFELRKKFGIEKLNYHVMPGVPFLLPREIAEKYVLSDPGNFMLYNGEEQPEEVEFVPIMAYKPPPTFVPKEEEQELPVEVKIFLGDLMSKKSPKVHIDMIVPGEDSTSILTDPNITMGHVKRAAELLEVVFNDNIGREKLVNRIIEVATAKVNNE